MAILEVSPVPDSLTLDVAENAVQQSGGETPAAPAAAFDDNAHATEAAQDTEHLSAVGDEITQQLQDVIQQSNTRTDAGLSGEEAVVMNTSESQEVELRRSARERRYPAHLDEYIALAAVAQLNEPTTVQEALQGDDGALWEGAMNEEMESLGQHQVWNLVELPKGRQAIKNKWVFRKKLTAEGDVNRYKARLVVKGCSQKEGIDFKETFAPVMKFATLRFLLALAAQTGMHLHQLDVKTAFLNGDLEEEIYMEQPEGFEVQSERRLVCRLNKSLYGLKQAPRAWHEKLEEHMSHQGFRQVAHEHCLFIMGAGNEMVLLGVYVDDILLLSHSLGKIVHVKTAMSKAFEIKDMGEATYILGMRIIRNKEEGTITLSQTSFIETILDRFGMSACKSIRTPMDANQKLSKQMGVCTAGEAEDMQGVPYQQLIGSIMYLMVGSRPDIAFSVGVLCQYMQKPGVEHWRAAQRVLRYLQGSKDLCLTFTRSNGGDTLIGFCDASFGDNLDDGKSTTGAFFTLAGAAITWMARKQDTVALSTVEAEYTAINEACKDGLWLRGLLNEVGIKQHYPTLIHSDSTGAVALARNPVQHQRTKHINVKYHRIRELLKGKEISLAYLQTEHQPADAMTKALPEAKFVKCRVALGLGQVL